eukprot:CAMPEP_0115580218 /NCGR_PEP_ID=MMETSP0272-20121206/4506_1 /TAXON_ID=71861 /ORGANISM="Scrippsiella trochoidea, Strain CCMP3099" /LENGTH=223 /DNA_ID=CAMNT_0003015117 /DNA_START=62 /DNA_END=730 /DNA_ORIENTATION=+
MTIDEWTQMNAGIELGGVDVSMRIQMGIYHALADGFKLPSETLVVPRVHVAPTMEGRALVHYNGRAQVSHNGIPADFPELRPRLLAARGGVSSAGRSADDEAIEEPAWLSLHRWFLFFAPTAEASGGASGERPAPPYGFISLRRTALRVADAQGRRLVLASRGESQPLPPVGNAVNCDDWLEMCLLLADGRFQPMEAPRLQLRFEEAAAYEAWAAIIGEACAD